MKKVLFFIPNLAQGGAEKVLVNLVNNLDPDRFEVTVRVLFPGGVNEQFLKPRIRLESVFKKPVRGISMLLKPVSPKLLHKRLIKGNYDIEISYHEGICSRIIGGCADPSVRTVSWIHVEQHTAEKASFAFRSKSEAESVYNSFDRIICVSNYVKRDFTSVFNLKNKVEVLYNTVESAEILRKAAEETDKILRDGCINLIAVGTLKPSKGYDRLFRVIKKLIDEGVRVRLYVLGTGADEQKLLDYIAENDLKGKIILLGYDTNPYKYVSRCDLFVCASFAEGFSTAATEALIVGTPVCTTDVSGMREMLGDNNEYGIVTENSEEALYKGIKTLAEDPALLRRYKKQAEIRGKAFDTESTVRAVEKMLKEL